MPSFQIFLSSFFAMKYTVKTEKDDFFLNSPPFPSLPLLWMGSISMAGLFPFSLPDFHPPTSLPFTLPESSQLHRGIYSGQPEKFFPPPSKILPCFSGFFALFKLHKGILTCVISLSSFFLLFSPFPFLFSSPPSNSSLGMVRIYIPAPTPLAASAGLLNYSVPLSLLNQLF